MRTNDSELPTWFLLFFCFFPIVDVINGWILSIPKNIPFGILYRMLFIFACLLMLSGKNKIDSRQLFHLLMINTTFFVMICLFQAFYFQYSLALLIDEFSAITKYLLFFLVSLVFVEYPPSIVQNTKMLIFVNTGFSLGLIIPYLLKIGNHTYSNSAAGYKGFYFATNDISYSFIMLVTLLIFQLIDNYTEQRTKSQNILWVSLGADMFCLFIIGTKSGLAYILLMSLYLFFEIGVRNRYISYQLKFLTISSTLIFILLILLGGYKIIIEQLSGVITRITYFYYLYDGNLLKVLSSSRTIFLANAVDRFLAFPNNHWILFFGFGVINRMLLFSRDGYIEMDFFDTIFSYGVIGTVVFSYTLKSVYSLVKGHSSRLISRNTIPFIVSLFYAFFSGHVFYSGMSAMMFGWVISRDINRIGAQ